RWLRRAPGGWPRAAVALALGPRRLPPTSLPRVLLPKMATPAAVLPEMTFGLGPKPMVLKRAPLRINTPSPPLGTATVPVAFVPMKLPEKPGLLPTTLKRARGPLIITPGPRLPEMTLPRSTLLVAGGGGSGSSMALMTTPAPRLPAPKVWNGSMPMKQPSMVLALLLGTRIPARPLKERIVSERTVEPELPGPPRTRPFADG